MQSDDVPDLGARFRFVVNYLKGAGVGVETVLGMTGYDFFFN